MTSPAKRPDRVEPIWFCVWCGHTSLDPCDHSPMYRWAWNGKLQPVTDRGTLLRDEIAEELEQC